MPRVVRVRKLVRDKGQPVVRIAYCQRSLIFTEAKHYVREQRQQQQLKKHAKKPKRKGLGYLLYTYTRHTM